MRRYFSALFMTITAWLPAASVPGSSLTSLMDSKVIRVATQSPLTGPLSVVGTDIKLGAQLALEQHRQALTKMGFQVELAPFDDQANPDTGVANAKTIVADSSILAVIGHYNSGVQVPSSEEYHAASLCNLSPANTNPKVTNRGYPEINRICGRDDVQGAVAALFAQGKGIRRAFVLHDKSSYGMGIAEEFQVKAKGSALQVLGTFGTEEKYSFDSILVPLLKGKPDCIFFAGMFDQAALLFRQARERGFQGLCLSVDGFDSADSAKIAGDSLLQGMGTYFTTISGPPYVYPGARTFIADFERRFGHKPRPFSAQAYDCMVIALKGMENAIKDNGGMRPQRAQVAKAVRAIRDFSGITGPVTFNGQGDHVQPRYLIIQVTIIDPSRWAWNRIDHIFDVAPPAATVPVFPELVEEPSASNPAEDGDDIFRLGMVAPLTGEAATFGKSSRNGIDLAVSEWNARGGVLGKPIKLFVADDQGDPSEGASVYVNLTQRNRVSAIVGPIMSKVGLAGAPICQAGRVPMLSPTATNPIVTRVGNYIFRIAFIDPFQGTVGANFAFHRLKTTRAACLFDSGNDYTKGLSEKFREEYLRLGGQVVAFEGHATGITRFNAHLERILATRPQILYVSDYYNDAAVIIRQARSLGFKGPVLGGDGWDSPRFTEIGGRATENTYYTNHFTVDDTSSAVRDFVRRYKVANHSQEPDAISALSYDAANVMLEAVRSAGSPDGPAIRAALQATNLQTVCGRVRFNEDRNPVKPAIILKIVNGKSVYFATIEP